VEQRIDFLPSILISFGGEETLDKVWLRFFRKKFSNHAPLRAFFEVRISSLLLIALQMHLERRCLQGIFVYFVFCPVCNRLLLAAFLKGRVLILRYCFDRNPAALF
jgi:hypothetical protein